MNEKIKKDELEEEIVEETAKETDDVEENVEEIADEEAGVSKLEEDYLKLKDDYIRLYAEMGHYDIVSYGQGLIGWFKRLFDIRKKSEK